MPDLFEPVSVPFIGASANTKLTDADVVVFGAPHGTPYPGVDNASYSDAPDTLRRALEDDARWLDHWDFDLGGPLLGDGRFVVADAGNLRTSPPDGAGNRDLIRSATAQIVAGGAIPVMIGGDDSTPIPFIEALEPLGPLTIIQIDAHIDWREEVDIARHWGAKIVTARDFHRGGLETVLTHLKRDANCMITFDCDGLDPSIMPAVMAPTPGGLTYMQSIDLIDAVIRTSKLVALDMVEFVPERDRDGIAAITAARILANVLGGLAR